jgi:hypothetical protein
MSRAPRGIASGMINIIKVCGGFVIHDEWDRCYCGRDGYWARFAANATPFPTYDAAERVAGGLEL